MEITASTVKELREKTGVGMMNCKNALKESNGDFEAAVKLLREKGLSTAQKKADRSANEGSIFTMTNSDNTKGVILELSCETDFVAKNDDFLDFGRNLATTLLEGDSVKKTSDLESFSLEGKPFSEVISEIVLRVGENVNVKNVGTVNTTGTVFNYTHMNGKIGVLIEFDKAVDAGIGNDLALHVAASAPLYLTPSEMPTEELDKEKDIIRNQLKNEGKPEQIIDKIVEGKIRKYYKEVCLIEQDFIKDTDKSIRQYLPENVNISSYIRYQIG
ncbi:MAG: elongation factor Ts [Candidatus Marinamargulisbacteria bacterium]|jgi:elongation factor Ts